MKFDFCLIHLSLHRRDNSNFVISNISNIRLQAHRAVSMVLYRSFGYKIRWHLVSNSAGWDTRLLWVATKAEELYVIFCSIGLEQPGGLAAVVCEQRCPDCKSEKKKGKGGKEGKRKKGERTGARVLFAIALARAQRRRDEIIDSAVKIIERKRASRCLPGRRAIQSRGTPARNRDNGTRHEPLPPPRPPCTPFAGGLSVCYWSFDRRARFDMDFYVFVFHHTRNQRRFLMIW